ncbi:alpha/beta hydrolase [Saccharopolyspora flava]|uniref:Pimeloyl-ACP methyl ester carboxylesterase n=1 Tax=Saccharopolyspora flava TaxID=95161 RepID=A0A1I6UZE7_9PSEU|nr:alpha/beta hydrolase [Saccharopolyspora flava]SFT06756.1 Pimeloyl-ACP methyl ester carboxylesterase [Saccharopolyspora flava]
MSTFLLVHGAWHTGRAWDRVVPLLAGHRVLAPTLTGYGETAHLLAPETGVHTHSDDLVRLILAEDLRDVVLVGHSYAGLVISDAANQVPERISQLIYLDAMVPEDGETAADVMPQAKKSIDLALRSESGFRVPPPDDGFAGDGLFGVTDPDDLAWLRSMLSDHSVGALQQPVRLDNPATRAIPRAHIHCTDVPEGFVRRPVPTVQPNGSPAVVHELPTGHDCMITMPGEVARLLVDLARGQF